MYMVHAILRPDVPPGAPGHDYRCACSTIVEASDMIHARRGVIDVVGQRRYLVSEFVEVSEYNGPIPPEGGNWKVFN